MFAVLCFLPAISLSAGTIPTLKFGDRLTVTGVEDAEDGAYWYIVELPDGTNGYILSTSILTESMTESAACIGNKNSKVFDQPTCRNLPSSGTAVSPSTRDEAINKGYRPCGNCTP